MTRTTFNRWAKAAGDRPKPMTEVSMAYQFTAGASLAFADGTMEEHVDKSTGEVTDREKVTFLPKSQIRIEEVDSFDELVKGKVYTIHLPEWLAKDRGLL